ncbi:hypothetical protein F8B43_5528 [Methylorubrum populi]|uniref:Uncharacterized protein n=1 Tax=Methylorubrum populi TaxID=223967 RepID=A0A833MYT1_9HYPH|nr:hypothetical protein F8B43_5528 [Methylorubrum populi]
MFGRAPPADLRSRTAAGPLLTHQQALDVSIAERFSYALLC